MKSRSLAEFLITSILSGGRRILQPCTEVPSFFSCITGDQSTPSRVLWLSAPVCSSQGTAVILRLPFTELSGKCSRSAGTHIQVAASEEAPWSVHRHISHSQHAQYCQILGSKYVVFLPNNGDVASWSPRLHVRRARLQWSDPHCRERDPCFSPLGLWELRCMDFSLMFGHVVMVGRL